MSDKDPRASGSTEDNSVVDDSIEEKGKQDKVAYDTYSKVLSEAKKAKALAKERDAEAAKLKEELDKYKQSEMQSQGKQAELVEALRKQLADTNKKLSETHQSFAYKAVNSEITKAALQAGCIKPDALIKLMDLSALEVNQDFTVNQDDLSRLIADAQKEHEYLFKKQVAGVKDANPGVSKADLNGKMDLSKMTLEQKIKLMAQATMENAYTKNSKQ